MSRSIRKIGVRVRKKHRFAFFSLTQSAAVGRRFPVLVRSSLRHGNEKFNRRGTTETD